MVVHGPELRPYTEAKLGIPLSPEAQFFGRLYDNGQVWGVIAFDNFSEFDAEVFCAGEKGWGSRRFISTAFSYPFLQLKKKRVTARVDENDEGMWDIDLRIGFKEEGRLRDALGDRDVIILGMLKNECRWVKNG